MSRFCSANTQPQQRSRNPFNRKPIGPCRNCGKNRTPNYGQVCIAMGKECNHCGLLNHFAKKSRKKQNNNKNTPQDNHVNNHKILKTESIQRIKMYFSFITMSSTRKMRKMNILIGKKRI